MMMDGCLCEKHGEERASQRHGSYGNFTTSSLRVSKPPAMGPTLAKCSLSSVDQPRECAPRNEMKGSDRIPHSTLSAS